MSTIPPSASLNLPPVTMSGKYVMEEHDTYSDQIWSIDELPAKQGYYLQGNYLRCVAEVGLEGIFDNLFPFCYDSLCASSHCLNNLPPPELSSLQVESK